MAKCIIEYPDGVYQGEAVGNVRQGYGVQACNTVKVLSPLLMVQ